MPAVKSEEVPETSAFACCSAGIGRWFWVAWESESDARASAPALASGYEASAERAEAKAAERLGTGTRRLPARWAAAYKRRSGGAAGAPGLARAPLGGEAKLRSRLGRPGGSPRRRAEATRLAFLYCATECKPPVSPGHVAVTRHRIVKQTARKIYVERDPFDEDGWARRRESGEGAPGQSPGTRTVAVDRATLRAEGRFRCGRTRPGPTFYASEEAGIRDVEAELTAKHAWCARLGVRFPCSVESVKAAYRRLAKASHPDAGGDPAEFRAIERAYREALAYFAQAGDGPD